MIKNPVSTITKTLDKEETLFEEIVEQMINKKINITF